MEAKHTPGPWRTRALETYSSPGHAVFWEDRSKPGVHLRRLDYQGCFTKADARLIAAAPELLAALKSVVSRWEGTPADQTPREVRDARRAIVLATELEP